MIATAKPQSPNPSVDYLHGKFVELLPSIQKQARVAFYSEPPERREELIAEVVANSWVAFVRLMERGLDDVIYASPLAQYAIRQTKAGRRVGGRLNVQDITSRHCQVVKGVRVGQLDHFNEDTEEWKEVLIEDRHAGPAEIAACRIDLTAWLSSLPSRHRRIATTLAVGESTGRVAKMFRVSSARISQIRRELYDAWRQFQGEDTVANQTAAVTA